MTTDNYMKRMMERNRVLESGSNNYAAIVVAGPLECKDSCYDDALRALIQQEFARVDDLRCGDLSRTANCNILAAVLEHTRNSALRP